MPPVVTFVIVNVFQTSFCISNIACCLFLTSARTVNNSWFLAKTSDKFKKLLWSHSLIVVDCQTFLKELI